MEDSKKHGAFDSSPKAGETTAMDASAPADTSYTSTTDEEVAALLIGLSDEDGVERSVQHSSHKHKTKKRRLLN